jgi:serine/threonine-protein kinase RsbT
VTGAAAPGRIPPATVMRVGSEFDVAGVVARIARLCAGRGLDAVFSAHVTTAASELANNLWMHAPRGGRVLMTLLERAGSPGVELVAEDDGPGIADLPLAMTEGYSSAGGMGCGLPGVRRLMDEFEIDSVPGRGTRVVARKWLRRRG